MRVGQVPHARGIFNLPASGEIRGAVRLVSLGLDYPNDFTGVRAGTRGSFGQGGAERVKKRATAFILHLAAFHPTRRPVLKFYVRYTSSRPRPLLFLPLP